MTFHIHKSSEEVLYAEQEIKSSFIKLNCKQVSTSNSEKKQSGKNEKKPTIKKKKKKKKKGGRNEERAFSLKN